MLILVQIISFLHLKRPFTSNLTSFFIFFYHLIIFQKYYLPFKEESFNFAANLIQ